MIYGYARVSTIGQAKKGNSLEDQVSQLKERGAEVVFSEPFTGTTTDRPEFQKLLSIVKPGDTIMTTKLDRVSRSAAQGIMLIDSLLDRGISFHILNMGLMDNTPAGKLIRNVMLAFAEFERDMIVQRTSEGKAAAKAKGKKVAGRNKIQISEFSEILRKQKDLGLSVEECCSEIGVSRRWWFYHLAEIQEIQNAV